MRHRLEARFPFCHVLIWGVNVQGDGAAQQVAAAISGFNLRKEQRPDVLIVARGGGSIEDLFVFNEEVVVRAVYESEIVVISAIGHETDTTLIDYAADLRAPTPTAAIELATPVLSDIKIHLFNITTRGMVAMSRSLRETEMRFAVLAKSLQGAKNAILNIAQKFDDKAEKFGFVVDVYFRNLQNRLSGNKMISLKNFVELKRHVFCSHSNIFDKLLERYIEKYDEHLRGLCGRLDQASYKKILDKGFCFITTKSGASVQEKKAFEEGRDSKLIIHFKDGDVELN